MAQRETQATTVAVFGSSGFVGRQIVAALESRGVSVLSVPAPRVAAIDAVDVATWVLRAGQTTDEIAAALANARLVVNAAGVADAASGDEADLNAANAASAGLIAAAARKAGVRRFVHVSSAAVQGSLPLDETRRQAPFSPYSRSKALGERIVTRFGPDDTVIYRPAGVHSTERGTTRAIRRLAASRWSTTMWPGRAPTPQALVENVADAVAFLALHRGPVKPIVLHPWEGLTTRRLLQVLGGHEPVLIPPIVARPALRLARGVCRVHPRLEAYSRRLEVLWLGQEQSSSWLSRAGWVPPVGERGWRSQATVPSEQAPTLRRRAFRPHSSRAVGTPRSGESARPRLLIATEHRCWSDESGGLLGRKALTAVASFGDIAEAVVVARSAGAEPVGVPLLDSPHRSLLVPWPSRLAGAPRLVSAARLVWREVGASDGVVVYCPGILGTIAGISALLRRRRLITVVVGDPSSSLGPDVVGPLASAMSRPVVTSAMRKFCRRATVARYVTAGALQAIYPPGPSTAVVSGSDVGEVAMAEPRGRPHGPISILTVGTLEREYKGVRELIKAARDVRDHGHEIRLCIAGTGRLEPELRRLASETLQSDVRFVGHVTGEELRRLYETSDLFVLASWTEGLPRALVEAMAAGMPCVATAVGGIPELLEPHRMVAPRNVAALARALEGVLEDSEGWYASSVANLNAARALVNRAAQADAEFATAVRRALAIHQ